MCNSSYSIGFSDVVAPFALIISALGVWMQYRNQLTVHIDPVLYPLSPENIFFNGLNNQFKNVVKIFKTQIDVVNYCSHDIAFFDLRVFNPKTNINHQFISKKAFPYDLPSDTKISIDGLFFYNYNAEIPERNYGIFKAHSFTRFDIIVYDFDKEAFENEIMLSFKISKRNWIREDPFAVTNRGKFKMYCQKYDINGWEKTLQMSLANEEYNTSNSPHEQEN